MGIEKRAAVKVLNSSMVVPEVETPSHGLWLSNLDLAVTMDYTNNFSLYRSEGDPTLYREKLKTSLSKALVPFYPLAGRLVKGPDGRLEVSCNGEGVLFVEAEMECTIDEFGDFMPGAEITKMLVPSPPSGDLPCVLLLLQITSFRCGGMTLGVSVHHIVVDGLSAFHFIGTWADIARGTDNLLPPFLDRSLLRARSPPMVLAENPAYALNSTQGPPHAEAKPFCTGMFLLSQDQLAALKMSGDVAIRHSTFKVVASHVWRCMCKARGLGEDQETRLRIIVDARNRLDPPLPKGFFGNATFLMCLTARAGDVMSEPLERTANRIHEETSRIGDEHVRSLVDFLELQPLQDHLRKLVGPLKNVRATDVVAVSWLGLPLYEADFGWGKPVLMRRAALLHSGIVYIMHHPGKEGGISLVVTLETEYMPEFEKIFYHGFSSKVREP